MLIYKCAKGNFAPWSIRAIIVTQISGHFWGATRGGYIYTYIRVQCRTYNCNYTEQFDLIKISHCHSIGHQHHHLLRSRFLRELSDASQKRLPWLPGRRAGRCHSTHAAASELTSAFVLPPSAAEFLQKHNQKTMPVQWQHIMQPST